MPFEIVSEEVRQPKSQSGILSGALKLRGLLIVQCRHGDACVDGGEDRAALGGIDPIAQCIEPLMQLGPERKAVSGRRGSRNRSQTGYMLMPAPAISAVGRYEARL